MKAWMVRMTPPVLAPRRANIGALFAAGVRGIGGAARRRTSTTPREARDPVGNALATRSRAAVERWGRPTGAASRWRVDPFESLRRPTSIQTRLFRVARADARVEGRRRAPTKTDENEMERQWELDDKRKKLRMRNLHRSAKMKRILVACDYWFSRSNLASDDFLKEELRDHKGHVPISTLATFPKLEHWGDDLELIYDTLTSEAAKKRYKVIFNRDVKVAVERNRRRRKLRRRRELLRFLQSREVEGESEEASAAKELLLAFQNKASIDDLEEEDSVSDEDLPSLVDDGSAIHAFALVRPKKVHPEDYAVTPREPLSVDKGKDESGEFATTTSDEEDTTSNLDNSEEKAEEPSPPTKVKRHKRYASKRQVCVIKNAQQLASFFDKLNSFADRSGSDAAIGFDVEYCRTEDDIRDTLPAMLTLASSDPGGIVGLVWLDKFPNQGKGMINDPACGDLLSVLNDNSCKKVGVGATKDAKNLAAWWGIDDPEFIGHFFSGMVDLEHNLNDVQLVKPRLKELCAAVLGLDLPKIKEWGARKNKRMRISGRRVKTTHWRRDDLTRDMKKYAADDASCSIDIWNKYKEGR
ncbi:hypothetical protein ACHAWF_013429 [Thalassiosira exigua]